MQNVTEQRDSLLLPFNSCARLVTRCFCGSVGNNQSNREQTKVFGMRFQYQHCIPMLLTHSLIHLPTHSVEWVTLSLTFVHVLSPLHLLYAVSQYTQYLFAKLFVVVLFLFSTTQINYKVDMKSELDLRLETKNISKYYMAALWRRAKCCCYN